MTLLKRTLLLFQLLTTIHTIQAQPGLRRINLNINEITPVLLEQCRFSDFELTITIDSDYDVSKFTYLKNLSEIKLTRIKLNVNINKLPEIISTLSDSLYQLQIGSSNNKLRDLSSLKKLKHLQSLTIVGNFNTNSLDNSTITSLLLIGYPNPEVPNLLHLVNLRSSEILNSNVQSVHILSYLRSLNVLKLRNLDSLKQLDWDGSKTPLLEIEIINCSNLQSVSALTSCRTVEFLGLSQLFELKKLDFNIALMSLKKMNIQFCGLKNIAVVASSKTLKTLNIGFLDSLTKIDFDMSGMNLDSLSISGNGFYESSIKDISGVFSCHTLKYLTISRLDALEIINIKQSKNKLRELYIDNCKVLKTISGISSCKFLLILNLNENTSLEKIPDLSDLAFIKEIYIQNNRFLKIPKGWNSYRISGNAAN